jgi:hypothetical protein
MEDINLNGSDPANWCEILPVEVSAKEIPLYVFFPRLLVQDWYKTGTRLVQDWCVLFISEFF